MTSELETRLVSVERVKEYSETATEVSNKLEEKRLLITAFWIQDVFKSKTWRIVKSKLTHFTLMQITYQQQSCQVWGRDISTPGTTWHEETWLEITWHEITWLEMTWCDMWWRDLHLSHGVWLRFKINFCWMDRRPGVTLQSVTIESSEEHTITVFSRKAIDVHFLFCYTSQSWRYIQVW